MRPVVGKEAYKMWYIVNIRIRMRTDDAKDEKRTDELYVFFSHGI